MLWRTTPAFTYALFLFLGSATDIAGQDAGEVTGVVREVGTGEPVVGASVSLQLVSDTTVARSGVTNGVGRLLFVGVPAGTYRVRVTSLAYGDAVTEAFELGEGGRHDLGVVTMAIEALELDALDVTAERSAVIFEPDRTSYDVTAMPSAQGAATADLLRNMPELDVDLDGQISMNGSATEVYIDGRPAPMNGLSLTAFLEQFPAENIERVEVITNPSARYGAQGTGGIVNIVLREGVELGLTGVAFANGGTRGQAGLGSRATLQRGPWTINGGLSLGRQNRESSSFDLRQNLLDDPTTFLEQQSSSHRTGSNGNGDLEIRYEPNERARFWVQGRLGGSDDGSEGLNSTIHQDEDRIPTASYTQQNTLDAQEWSGRFGTGFSYEWERRRHEFEIELEIDRSRDQEDTREELDPTLLGTGNQLFPADLTLEEERQRERELRLEVDYVRPWTEDGRLEVGYHLESAVTGSDRLLTLTDGAGSSTPTELGFDHDQVFNSAYVTLQRQLGPVGIQVGVRGEHADTRLETPTGEVFDNDYMSWFPSASVSARLDEEKQLRLSYSRRIGRPSPSVLNPIDRSTDPLNRRIGNPYIDPEYTHSVNLDATWSTSMGRLRLSPYYRRSDGGWADLTTVDEEGVSTRYPENLTSEERYGASVTAWLPRGNMLNGFLRVSGDRTVRDASNLSERYSGSSFRWQTRLNLETTLTEDLSVEGRFNYSPAVDLPQGRSDARVSTDFGLRYRFLDRRASLRMSFEDPLGLQEQSFETRDLTWVQIGRSSESTRSIRFSLSYAFGGGGSFSGGRRGR